MQSSDFNESMVYEGCSSLFDAGVVKKEKDIVSDFLLNMMQASLPVIKKSDKRYILVFDDASLYLVNQKVISTFYDFAKEVGETGSSIVLVFHDFEIRKKREDASWQTLFEIFDKIMI